MGDAEYLRGEYLRGEREDVRGEMGREHMKEVEEALLDAAEATLVSATMGGSAAERGASAASGVTPHGAAALERARVLFLIRRHTTLSPYVAPRFPHMS